MQYFNPAPGYFAGDCMPFFHEGVFHLYYLLDENHHAALGGLGGHQWAHASTTDLIHWTHHPLALAITNDFEGSICTGSVFFHQGAYHAFYATRMRDHTQHLGLALSPDGVTFEKTLPNPFASPPPGYHPQHFRDPAVFQHPETGQFHLLVTAQIEDYPVTARGGCLAQLVSPDLTHWKNADPFIIPGFSGVPECPDYFEWNGWYYLLFSNGGVARYRMSRHPLGPWLRPRVDTLDGPAARVMKTAPFTHTRRIGAAWLGTRAGDHDTGNLQFGGSVLLREIIQHPDGTLGARILPETLIHTAPALAPTLQQQTPNTTFATDAGSAALMATAGLEAIHFSQLPQDFHFTAQVTPVAGDACTGAFGLRLRAGAAFDTGCDLRFSPTDQTVQLNAQPLTHVETIRQPFQLDVVACGSILDVCIGGSRCVVERAPQQTGAGLWLYAWDAHVTFESIKIFPV